MQSFEILVFGALGITRPFHKRRAQFVACSFQGIQRNPDLAKGFGGMGHLRSSLLCLVGGVGVAALKQAAERGSGQSARPP